jgi:E3 ubiquitin-protein ligase DCST1
MFILFCRGLRALVLKLADRFEFVGDLIFEQREKRKTIKIILSGVCGAVYGLLLLKFILYSFNIHLSFLASALTHAFFVLLFANLCAFSLQFRCILVLILLEGFGKAGRNILKALVIFLILTGPVSNIVSNCKEVARVFECTTYLTFNLTKTKFDLVVKPFTNAFARMDLSEVHASFQQITNVIHPIIHEVETSFSRKRLVY